VLSPGATTAQEQFAHFVKEEIAPSLRSHGFKGSGKSFRLDRGDYRGTLAFQGSVWNTSSHVEFTVNLKASHLPTKQGYWRNRLGHLLRAQEDVWWSLPAGASTDQLREDLLECILDYGIAAFDAALNSASFPPDPVRHWSRTFDMPTELPPQIGERPILPHELPLPRDLDEAFRLLSDPLSGEVGRLEWFVYQVAPLDPRLPSVLLRILESSANAYIRASAAIKLAFLSGSQAVALSGLHESAAWDEDLGVRIAARYAIALLG
jgi:hypothetical protein